METRLTGDWTEITTIINGPVKVILWSDGSREEDKGIEVHIGPKMVLCRSWSSD
jgi:hypothetical protein